MTTGLTLGKFAPLHRGHQAVIETSLSEMDHTMVLIYDVPDTTNVPLPVRAAWIRELYPTVEVLEAWDGPVDVGYTPEITRRHDEYLQRRLKGRQITHFYSSEPYGAHVSQALNAVDRIVDVDRLAIPISGSAIRQNPFQYREYLDSRVYRDLVTYVAILGAPSTGKTTLAQSLAEQFSTVWMPEYGREYWEQHQVDRRLEKWQLLEIAEGHLTRENQIVKNARDYLFVDTEAITTYVFSRYYHQSADPRLEQLASQSQQRYDLFLLCETDIPYDDTWDRSGEVARHEFHRRITSELASRKIPYTRLRGSVAERCRQVADILGAFSKY